MDSGLPIDCDDVRVVTSPSPHQQHQQHQQQRSLSQESQGSDESCDDTETRTNYRGPSSATAAASAVGIQYDPQDHTEAAPPTSSKTHRRVWVLPRALLPAPFHAATPINDSTKTQENTSSSGVGVGGGYPYSAGYAADANASSTRTSTQSVAAAAPPPAAAAAAAAAVSSAGMTSALLSSPSAPLTAHPVRLPHPRHGQPTLYLVQPHPPPPPSSLSAADEKSTPAPAPVLFEVQAQAPPGGFAQSWFVDESVLPSQPHNGEMTVVTPVDVTYMALRALLGDAAVYERLARTFMTAEDLYRSAEGQTVAGGSVGHTRDSALGSGRDANDDGDGKGEVAPQTDGLVSVFGGLGGGCHDKEGDDGESQSSASSSSSPYRFDFSAPQPKQGPASTRPGIHAAASATARREAAGSGPLESAASLSASASSSLPTHSGEWRGWAHAAAHHPLLFHSCYAALCSDSVLRRFCEVREVGGSGGGGGDAAGQAEVYYRPSEHVAVAWLKSKVDRLRASAVLREVLQLPDEKTKEKEDKATAVPTSSNGSDASTTITAATEAVSSAAAEVPVAIAFGLVSEYVPERLHGLLAVACGLPDPSAPPHQSTTHGGGTSGVGVKRDRDDGVASVGERKTVAAEAPVPSGPKSASVKRLEKAGRPKGTPTLFSMFAKKKKDDG